MYYLPHQESMEVLESLNVTKEQLFKEMTITFDYALPQDWLNALASLPGAPSYNTIISTTVWAYPPGLFAGIPVTCCIEVQQAINKLNKKREKALHHVYV